VGIRTLCDRKEHKVALYDSVTGYAFGPVIEDHEWDDGMSADAETLADGFLDWCRDQGHSDLRLISDGAIGDHYNEYLQAEHDFQADEIIAKRGDGDNRD